MKKDLLRKNALEYHSMGRPGKIEVVPTKPHSSPRDLALAYSPGVAEPCLEIKANPDDVYKYTAKGNLVAVISNGTAVLGLGNIGAEAGKPVMEGKGLLFKIYSDIDVFDIEVNETDVDRFVATVKAIAPTFGGINLEDIKSPECFAIEERLKKELDIPVMHDDQHGTAIITSAGFLNALEISNKKIEEVQIVVNGAGASAISCTKLYVALGAKLENIVMVDSKGVIRIDRTDLNEMKKQFATNRPIHTLAEALKGADMFLGLSVGGALTPEMLLTMAPHAIVFALANPTPEISYELATATRKDIIMATGRSDYPNQVNNVLGFPYIFRGALDVRAKAINEEMKLAAVYALSELAKAPVPEEVNIAYQTTNIKFGKDYIIPKPSDPRLITHVAPAVAKAAMDSGVARTPITDWSAYEQELTKRLGLVNPFMRQIKERACKCPKRVLFSEAENYKILKAAEILIDEHIAIPILLGNEGKIHAMIKEYDLALDGAQIIDHRSESMTELREAFAEFYYQKRQRKGVTRKMAHEIIRQTNYFGAMLVEKGYADTMISGLTSNYPETIRPALHIIGVHPGVKKVSGMYILNTKKGTFFMADATVNIDPTVDDLVEITLQAARMVKEFNIKPRIAMLSFSNFGSTSGTGPSKVQKAVEILHREYPELIVDGELQANFALNKIMLQESYPFSTLVGEQVNTLIFPELTSANIAYKLLQELDAAEAIGPVLMGLNKAVHVLQMGCTVSEIVNMATIAVLDSQCIEEEK